jgi:putative ABC transport system substrate-binding protein
MLPSSDDVSAAGSRIQARIGLLHFVGKGDAHISTQDIPDFRQGMERIGYREGENVSYVELYGDRDMEKTRRHAAEIMAWKPHVICSFLTNANIALREATHATRTPVVCWATNLKEAGLIESYRRPGTNFTGFSYEPYSQFLKIRFLKLMTPGLKRVAHLYNSTYSPAPAVLRDMKEAADLLGLEFQVYEVRKIEEFAGAVQAMAADACGAVAVGPHELMNRNGALLGPMFLDARLPAVGNQLSITRSGGLATYGSPKKRGWPLMANVVDDILRGADPAEIPIERGLKSVVTLNMGTVRRLQLTLPESAMDEVDILLEYQA